MPSACRLNAPDRVGSLGVVVKHRRARPPERNRPGRHRSRRRRARQWPRPRHARPRINALGLPRRRTCLTSCLASWARMAAGLLADVTRISSAALFPSGGSRIRSAARRRRWLLTTSWRPGAASVLRGSGETTAVRAAARASSVGFRSPASSRTAPGQRLGSPHRTGRTRAGAPRCLGYKPLPPAAVYGDQVDVDMRHLHRLGAADIARIGPQEAVQRLHGQPFMSAPDRHHPDTRQRPGGDPAAYAGRRTSSSTARVAAWSQA